MNDGGVEKMVKIKREVKKNLPQLIEWAWKNGIKNERYKCSDNIPYEYVWINGSSDIEFDDDMCISKNDTFTVEVEEVVTEKTKFELMIEITDSYPNCLWEEASVEDWKDEDSKEFHAYIDGEFKLIWRDGKLVE